MPMQPGQSQNLPGQKERQQEQSIPSKDQPSQRPGQPQQEQSVPEKQTWQTPGQEQSKKPNQPC